MEETADAFRAAYATLGYVECSDGRVEYKIQKIAIYVDDTGKPTHAARQLEDGRWTSKLGQAEDITHDTPDEVLQCVPLYGCVSFYMRRGVGRAGLLAIVVSSYRRLMTRIRRLFIPRQRPVASDDGDDRDDR